jgi:hypothetical protein
LVQHHDTATPPKENVWMTEHLETITSNRGFDRLPPIPSTHAGDVRVFESSAADGPHIWLKATAPANLNEPEGRAVEAPLHLTAENAWRLAEQLMLLVRHHYQGDARPEQLHADLLDAGSAK